MAYVVFLLGLILSGCGGYVLYLGFDDLTTERGLALTMSGTVAFSVGVAVLAIGFAVFSLGRLNKKLVELNRLVARGPVVVEEIASPSGDGAMDGPSAERLTDRTPPALKEDSILGAVEDAIFSARSETAPVATGHERSGERPIVPALSASREAHSGTLAAGAAVGGAAAVAAAILTSDLQPGKEASDVADFGSEEDGHHDEVKTSTPDPEPASSQPLQSLSSQEASSRLADTHAEIDRLIEELAAESPGAAAVASSASFRTADLPPEPDIYRNSVLKAALAEEVSIDAAKQDEPAASETVKPIEAEHPTGEQDRPDGEALHRQPAVAEGDLDYLEPVRDEAAGTLSNQTQTDADWLDHGEERAKEASEAAGAVESHALGEHHASEPDELAHLDPVSTDHDSTTLREGTHQFAPEETQEVIGSYESAGVTYTLYADGSVVAAAGATRESYPSLEALRAAFERGESIFSV